MACVALWISLHDWDIEKSMAALTSTTIEETSDDNMEPAEELPEDTETPEKKDSEEPEKEGTGTENVPDATVYPTGDTLPEEPTVIDGVLLANKQHPLPASYEPGEDPEARTAFETMRTDALKEGIDLVAFSTYRGFARQKELYTGYVARDGQEAADRYSARPGFSEHQTGLAFDIGEAGQEQHWASASFGDTEGGKWLRNHAHQYGFILRYPEGAESITGYMHESWHFRYVGKEIAEEIHEKEITLEEYLQLH
ncbi:D-alanyl-D-alanine carboxypeptidase family protein [Planococcus salinus]|uniref:D-alanyl-D-alanine carboxypeptidase family protein n=2 Tax=Planococcus salinus TaxID=1848460 RepID=A0A3M8P4H8_9BACL|nr:D-alanyl-D-alanine carboxypeptidase family protein [Planococcus salinus]